MSNEVCNTCCRYSFFGQFLVGLVPAGFGVLRKCGKVKRIMVRKKK